MVQINLLPDVKQEYLKSRQSKHAFVIGAGLVSVIFISISLLMYAYVSFAQPRHLTNLQSDIDSSTEQAKEVSNSVEMVTVQGALEQLPGLQDKKQITSRLFNYVNSFTPIGVSYSEVKLDIPSGTLSLSGETSDYEQSNVLANNLKSAQLTYTENDSETTIQPFSQVVFTNLGRAEQTDSGKAVSFQITTQVDPALFRETVAKMNLKVKASSKELLIPTAKPFGDGGKQ